MVHVATAMTRADAGADKIYDELREAFGDASPKASGYLSETFFLRERELVLDVVGAGSGMVVDLACGAGLMTLPLVRAGRRVVGVDFNAAACRQAGRNGLGAVRGDAFDLPLANGVADLVVNVEFAQQYDAEAVGRMLSEVARVLRPGGRLVIVWSNRAALVHRVASTALLILNRLRGLASSDLILHAPPQVRSAAGSAGLVLDEWFAIFPPWRLRLARVAGPLTSMIGSSFVAVFRKDAEP